MVLFCLGNELQGNFRFLQDLLGELKRRDPSRLYTMTSNRLWLLDAPAKLGETNMPPLVDDFLVERAFWNKKEKDGMRGQTFFAENAPLSPSSPMRSASGTLFPIWLKSPNTPESSVPSTLRRSGTILKRTAFSPRPPILPALQANFAPNSTNKSWN
ncbi:hypothetical protein EBT11_09415 [bacterium]|nr:hypothetical protein [bacterium]